MPPKDQEIKVLEVFQKENDYNSPNLQSISDLANQLLKNSVTGLAYSSDQVESRPNSTHQRTTWMFDRLFNLLVGLTDVMSNMFDPSVVPGELKEIRDELTDLRKDFNRTVIF